MNMREKWDVVVTGGGVSGCAAAIASARAGARTLLVERYGFLGGSLTNAGVGPMMTFHAGKRQVVAGIAQELVDRLCASGGCLGHLEDTTGYASSVTPFDAEALKLVLDEMMEENGVAVLLHASLVGVERDGEALKRIDVHTKGGTLEFEANVFVDATGDADLAFLAGVPIRMGRPQDGLCQPMTTNMKVADVDIQELKMEIRLRPENFNIRDLAALDRSPRLSVAGFYEEFNQAKTAGEISTQREDVLLFETVRENEVIVNTTRVIRLNPVDPWQLSRAEREGRRQAAELMRFFRKRCAGFARAKLISTGVQIGVRESRRIIGEYLLTEEDLLSSRPFADAIALGGYPIDIHNPVGADTRSVRLRFGQYYAIPLRALIAKGVDNLLAAGRCISVTHEAGAAIRVTPIAMAIGQAAGTAAALSASKGCALRDVDFAWVQEKLGEQGALFK